MYKIRSITFRLLMKMSENLAAISPVTQPLMICQNPIQPASVCVTPIGSRFTSNIAAQQLNTPEIYKENYIRDIKKYVICCGFRVIHRA